MAYREFLVPTWEEILNALGVEPVSSAEDPSVQIIRVGVGDNDIVVLSYDVVGCSVRCTWSRGGEQIFDLFREAATRLTVVSGHGEARLAVHFETDVLAGELEIRVYPGIRVSDRLLIR